MRQIVKIDRFNCDPYEGWVAIGRRGRDAGRRRKVMKAILAGEWQ